MQGSAHVPFRDAPLSGGHCSTHRPLLHLPLQHGSPLKQERPFGWHIGVVVDVEVVLVEVLVVLLVDVLVEVGGVESHGPSRSPWRRWPATALWGTSMVCSSGVPGLWQMVTFCC